MLMHKYEALQAAKRDEWSEFWDAANRELTALIARGCTDEEENAFREDVKSRASMMRTKHAIVDINSTALRRVFWKETRASSRKLREIWEKTDLPFSVVRVLQRMGADTPEQIGSIPIERLFITRGCGAKTRSIILDFMASRASR